jgi:hypothetical protein
MSCSYGVPRTGCCCCSSVSLCSFFLVGVFFSANENMMMYCRSMEYIWSSDMVGGGGGSSGRQKVHKCFAVMDQSTSSCLDDILPESPQTKYM